MSRTFGAAASPNDDDQLQPPAELTEVDPDPYGEADADTGPDIAALTAGDDEVVRPEVIGTGTDNKLVTAVELSPAERLAKARAELEAAEAAQAAAEPTGTAVALVERWDIKQDSDEVWTHDFLEFEGDLLGIRLPKRQALAAFSLASSKYVGMGTKNDLTGLFIARHLSPESYGRVFSRLMDPDDEAYDVDTVGALFNAIVTASIDADAETPDTP